MARIHFYLARFWFLANAVIALLPQLHWAAGGYEKLVFGQSATLVYFLFVSFSITASLIYAYWEESARGAFDS